MMANEKQNRSLKDKLTDTFFYLQEFVGRRVLFPVNWRLKTKTKMGYVCAISRELLLLLLMILTGKKKKLVIIRGYFLKYGDGGEIEISTEDILCKIFESLKKKEVFYLFQSGNSGGLLNFCELLLIDPIDTIKGIVTQQGLLIFFAKREAKECVVKFAYGAEGKGQLKEQKEILEKPLPFNKLYLPELLNYSEGLNSFIIVQKFVSGTNVGLSGCSEDEYFRLLTLAASELLMFDGHGANNAKVSEVDPRIFQMSSYFKDSASVLERAIAIFFSWSKSFPVNSAHVHGDYQINNILFNSDSSAISGIIDWDRAESNGFPLHDVLHLVVSSYASRHNIHRAEVLAILLTDKNNMQGSMSIITDFIRKSNIDHSHMPFLVLQLWLKYFLYAYNENMTFTDRWLEGFTRPLSYNLDYLEQILQENKKGNK